MLGFLQKSNVLFYFYFPFNVNYMKLKLAVFVLLLLLLVAFRYSSFYAKNFAYTIAPINPEYLTGRYDSNFEIGVFYGKQVKSSSSLLVSADSDSNVLGDSDLVRTFTDKRIEIDLTNQMLYAYDGENLAHTFLVSTGLWNTTPTGTYKIWINLRSTTMIGGSQELGTYYNLPNVPYTMYFYNDEIPKYRGYGLHGAYWHNNFGYPMSHGCINISPENSKTLFYWVNEGLSEDSWVIYNSENYVSPTITIYGKSAPY